MDAFTEVLHAPANANHTRTYIRNMAPNPIPEFTEKDKTRFWKRVAVNKPDECWPFDALYPNGYGQLKIGTSRHYAHRIAYILSGGSFENGPIVRHFVCRNRACCNPAHLRAGTYKDNTQDSVRDGTTQRGEKNRTANLTADDVRAIRTSFSNGATRVHLAAEYGMSYEGMVHVVNGRNWGHVA